MMLHIHRLIRVLGWSTFSFADVNSSDPLSVRMGIVSGQTSSGFSRDVRLGHSRTFTELYLSLCVVLSVCLASLSWGKVDLDQVLIKDISIFFFRACRWMALFVLCSYAFSDPLLKVVCRLIQIMSLQLN